MKKHATKWLHNRIFVLFGQIIKISRYLLVLICRFCFKTSVAIAAKYDCHNHRKTLEKTEVSPETVLSQENQDIAKHQVVEHVCSINSNLLLEFYDEPHILDFA